MLKLEKNLQDQFITLQWRKSYSPFNRLFFQALAIALAIHLGFFLLFRIQPFSIGSSFYFSPVEVNTDFFDVSEGLIAFSENSSEEEIPIPFFIKPPEVPTISSFVFATSIESILLNSNEDNRFILHFPSQVPLFYQPIQYTISGPLADLPIIKEPDFTKIREIQKGSSLTFYKAQYDVKVDENSGLIYWYTKKVSSGLKQFDQLAEKLLLDLRFLINDTQDILSGTIEITFLQEKTDV